MFLKSDPLTHAVLSCGVLPPAPRVGVPLVSPGGVHIAGDPGREGQALHCTAVGVAVADFSHAGVAALGDRARAAGAAKELVWPQTIPAKEPCCLQKSPASTRRMQSQCLFLSAMTPTTATLPPHRYTLHTKLETIHPKPTTARWLQSQCWFLSAMIPFWLAHQSVVSRVERLPTRTLGNLLLLISMLPWMLLVLLPGVLQVTPKPEPPTQNPAALKPQSRPRQATHQTRNPKL